MIQRFFFSVMLLLVFQTGHSQKDTVVGRSHQVAFSALLPVDEFSETHGFGVGLSYSWSNKRFGQLSAEPSKLFGFTAEGGFKYYFGSKVPFGDFDFRFKNYMNVHAFGGVIFNEGKQINVRALTGPVMGLYSGNTEFGFGAMLDGSYSVAEKFSIGPGVTMFKNKEANAQWSVLVKAAFSL